jgi:hypothetical protein
LEEAVDGGKSIGIAFVVATVHIDDDVILGIRGAEHWLDNAIKKFMAQSGDFFVCAILGGLWHLRIPRGVLQELYPNAFR